MDLNRASPRILINQEEGLRLIWKESGNNQTGLFNWWQSALAQEISLSCIETVSQK
jgi:hypothetical protein